MDKTRTERKLELVEQAIEKLLAGNQSVTVDGVTYQRVDLAKLQAYEERLEQKLQRERVCRVSSWPFFGGRR